MTKEKKDKKEKKGFMSMFGFKNDKRYGDRLRNS